MGCPNNMTDEQLIPSAEWARWAHEYVGDHLAKECMTTERRETILDTLVHLGTPEASGDTAIALEGFSTKALASIVENVFKQRDLLDEADSYGDNDLNQVLREYEGLGICYRIPKFNRDDQFIVLPNAALISWLFDPANTGSVASGAEENWSRGRMVGRYLVSERHSATSVAGDPLPVEALLYATVAEHVTVSAAHSDQGPRTPKPGDVDINIDYGQIQRIHDGPLDLDTIERRLSLGTTLPDPEGPYSENNDVGFFGELTLATSATVTSRRQLIQRLKQQLHTWIAIVQLFHVRKRGLDSDLESEKEADRGDEEADIYSEILEEADEAGVLASLTRHDDLIQRVARVGSIDGAVNRFGIDVTVDETDSSGTTTVSFGAYQRTRRDDPRPRPHEVA